MIDSISGMGGMMGGMSPQSIQQHQEKMFTKVDSDSSGTIDTVELSAFAEKLQEKTGATVNVEEMMSMADSDGDGVLSQEEFTAAAREFGPPPGARPPMNMNPELSAAETESTLLEMLAEAEEDNQYTYEINQYNSAAGGDSQSLLNLLG